MQCNAYGRLAQRGKPTKIEKEKGRKPAGISHHFLLGNIGNICLSLTHTHRQRRSRQGGGGTEIRCFISPLLLLLPMGTLS